MKTLTKIKLLCEPTSEAWLQQALHNLDTILLDHSHCERKAAGVAVNLLFRYPSHTDLIYQLTAIAKEELEHFEQVNQWLQKKGIPLAPLQPSPYGATLKGAIRRHEPHRLLDSLLVSALIEARSHERLGLLAENCPDDELAKFYRGLMASEARHYGIYWVLAQKYCDQEQIEPRLQELAQLESDILSNLYPEPRIHS
ncbi:tRNA-hydroxylase [Cyanobacterium stanieri PCC 7202]|uniref:tRNA-hydroxylase n=1 Tax=Cyanobacterium stanieri (strain ATCC 29140 / PCC 7202) TaxID=292563 RepID=K9YJ46_CYASC|nr:tRNA-hydroxylase [Cyanobacterium stanieri PCC 7202]